jgi:hypothetical protein
MAPRGSTARGHNEDRGNGGSQVGVLTKIATSRLGKRIGAEVTIGDKAALLDDSTAREVLDALEEHSVPCSVELRERVIWAGPE